MMKLSEAQLSELEKIRQWACCFEPERRFIAEVEITQLRELGTRTKSLLESSPGRNCDVYFFADWTRTRIDLQEEWDKALGGKQDEKK